MPTLSPGSAASLAKRSASEEEESRLGCPGRFRAGFGAQEEHVKMKLAMGWVNEGDDQLIAFASLGKPYSRRLFDGIIRWVKQTW